MDGPTFERLRAAVVRGELDPVANRQILDECLDVVTSAVDESRFPAHYSPTGSWDAEAIEEVQAAWLCDRAVKRGQVKAILIKSRDLQVFRSQIKGSVRQSIFDRLRRTQARNLFPRVRETLAASPLCHALGSGNNAHWFLKDGDGETFKGDDRALLNLAHELGHFEEIRFDPGARKLSHLLSQEDLEKFTLGMLGGAGMTAGTITRAVCLRFGVPLDDTPVDLAGHQLRDNAIGPEGEIILGDLAAAAADELSSRQMSILVGRGDGKPGAKIAEELGCSEATISMEMRNIREPPRVCWRRFSLGK